MPLAEVRFKNFRAFADSIAVKLGGSHQSSGETTPLIQGFCTRCDCSWNRQRRAGWTFCISTRRHPREETGRSCRD